MGEWRQVQQKLFPTGVGMNRIMVSHLNNA